MLLSFLGLVVFGIEEEEELDFSGRVVLLFSRILLEDG